MAYTIHHMNSEPGLPIAGAMIASGYTRQQTIRALESAGLLEHGQKFAHKLPTFGNCLIVQNDGPVFCRKSYVIVNR